MKAIYISFFGLFVFASSFAQENTITKTKFHWGRQSDTASGYAQAVLIDNVLYISGTVSRGKTMADQLKGVYNSLEKTLKNYGASFQNVVKENLFTTDIEAVKAANGTRKFFYKGDFPSDTWTAISRLYMPEALLEVEVIAYLPKAK